MGGSNALLAVSSDGAIAQWLGTAWGTRDTGSHPGTVAAVIDSDHIVVAGPSEVMFWDHGTWTTHTPPVTLAGSWQAVTATSPTDVWLASGRVRYHWDGTNWVSANDDAGETVNQMWSASGALLVAQDDAQIRARTASTWTSLTSGRSSISAVWGTSTTDIWAIAGLSFAENRTFHWDGSVWTEFPFPFAYDAKFYANAIWGSDPSNYWIAGGHQVSGSEIDDVLFHWDGLNWTLAGTYGSQDPWLGGRGFSSIWGSGSDDVYAIAGTVAGTVAVHRDASGWSALDTGGVPVGDVFGSGQNDVYLTINTGLLHWDGTAWTSIDVPGHVSLGWANSPTDVWLTGDSLLHYDGTFFVTLGSATSSATRPFGTTAEMWTYDLNGATKWIGGFGGTPTPEQLPMRPLAAWAAPDGHLWVAATGLIVH